MESNVIKSRYCKTHDVIIKVEDVCFYLEKDVLREKSLYFDAMFNGKFSEHSQQEVVIEIITAKSMTFILDYIYHHVLNIEDLGDVIEYVEAAMFFQLQHLVDLIYEGLLTKINYYSWAKIFQIFKYFNMTTLENKVRCFGLFNFQDVKRYMECIDSLEMLHWYLSHKYLNAKNEFEIFEAGCDWLLHTKNFEDNNNIFVILSCLNYHNLKDECMIKILMHPMVLTNTKAMQAISSIRHIINQNVNVDLIQPATLSDNIKALPLHPLNISEVEAPVSIQTFHTAAKELSQNNFQPYYRNNYSIDVSDEVSDIIFGFLVSVKKRSSLERPCVIRKRNNVFLKRFNSKTKRLENWLTVGNKDWWGHNVVVWKGFNIIVTCGEMNMGKNIWNTDVLIYNIIEEKWSVLNSVPSTPRRHAAALIHNDLMYIIGGVNSFRVSLDTVTVYDLINDIWSTLPNLPEFCQNPVATFHKGELYVSAEMLYVFRDNQWVTLFKNSMRHNSILSYMNCLYFAQNWRNSLNCWDSDSVIEYIRAYEQICKQTKYNITSMCRIGKQIYFLTEPEEFEKQTYCIERCDLDSNYTLATELLMESPATSDYSYNTSECFSVPYWDVEDESISDFGKKWLQTVDRSNGEVSESMENQ